MIIGTGLTSYMEMEEKSLNIYDNGMIYIVIILILFVIINLVVILKWKRMYKWM